MQPEAQAPLTVSVTELRRSFSKYLTIAEEGTPVIITRRGKPTVVLLGINHPLARNLGLEGK